MLHDLPPYQCIALGLRMDIPVGQSVNCRSPEGVLRPSETTRTMSCAFCELPSDRIVLEGRLAVVIRDGFPVSEGHTLVIPKRHVASLFEITQDERAELMDLLFRARDAIDRDFKPAGYNIGLNDGPAAGQTIPHLHIHLIPRYAGDRQDPRGGVRWVLPEKAAYWAQDRKDTS